VLIGGGERLEYAGKRAKNHAAISWDLPHPDNAFDLSWGEPERSRKSRRA
jgi:hypothetical protein